MNKETYCNKTLQELNISDSDNTVRVSGRDGFSNNIKIFQPDENDNLQITYLTLNKQIAEYETQGKLKPYFRTRINPDNPEVEKGKYQSVYQSGTMFFFPPVIIEKYSKGEAIQTLIVTEGEKKAFKASLHNIDCIGISGIHNYKDKQSGSLHEGLKQIVEKCKVKNIIFLCDADCISEKYIEQHLQKDLSKRLNSFYTAVKNFRELCKELDTDVYFSHIRSQYEVEGKGLDDLLVLAKGKEKAVREDLLKLTKSKTYFITQNTTDNSLSKLKEYFFLDLDKRSRPTSFYERFEAIIGEKDFIFNSITWQFKDQQLQIIKHPKAENYIRVGTDYYMKGHRLTAKSERVPDLKLWKIATIKQDYGNIPGFCSMILKYISFCNIPDNTENFQQEVDGCFNLYQALQHTPTEGNIDVTLNFLKHIFSDKLEIALDYLTIIYKKPTENLPVICLVSKDQKTGKSTFIRWLNSIYGANMIVLGNEDFQGNFNSHYASKLVIAIDESFIEKRLIKEKIKRLSTDDKINLEGKGKDIIQIPFIGKFILASNSETNIMQVDSEDNRFFVVKVSRIEKEDAFLLSKLEAEIPAFLHFLKHREIKHPKESRLWFNPSLYETDALRKLVVNSRSKLEKEITRCFSEMFDMDEAIEKLEATPTLIAKRVQEFLKSYNITPGDIEKILKEEWNLVPHKNGKFKFPVIAQAMQQGGEFESVLTWERYTGKYYTITKRKIMELSGQLQIPL